MSAGPRRIALVLALLMAAGSAHAERSAERFVAGHGFSAPVRVATTSGGTRAALAFDAGAPYAYWYDAQGVHRRRLGGDAPELWLAESGTRDVVAATVSGDPAVLLVVRDVATGRNAHEIVWRGRTRRVASGFQVRPVALSAADDGPAWAMRAPTEAGSALDVDGWARAPRTVRETAESIAGQDLAAGPDGALWVSWLEGSSDRTALGAFADWRAYVARVDPAGSVGAPIDLGQALSRGEADVTRVAVDAAGAVAVLWPDREGRLVATRLPAGAGSAGEGPERVEYRLGPGIAAGVFDGVAYWADGDRIRRRALAPGAEVETVLWAPDVILSVAAAADASGALYLVWHGGMLRGGSAVYAAGNASAFEPGWTDRLAAAMGWNPWELWTEALGQLLASVLAGTLLTMALAPVLWLAAAVAVRVAKVGDGTLLGVAIGAAVLGAALAVVRARAALPAPAVASLFGAWWELGLAVAVAAVATWLLRRRADAEPLLGTLVSAASCAGIAIALLAFRTFQAWTDVWGGFP